MINWQRILFDLKRDYKHIAAVAREIGLHHKTLQKVYRGERLSDLPYTAGCKLIELHKAHCHD